jgi:DNA helicase IV
MEDFYIDYAGMDELQRKYIRKRTDKHLVITGTAGSGKSVIALHKLRQVSQEGSYAIIVYTKSLKKYFIDGIEAMRQDRSDNYGEILDFNLNQIFYYQEWKDWYKNNPDKTVKHLIIDECQDFSVEEIDHMLSYGQVCFLFGDVDQTIMDFNDKTPMDPYDTARHLGIRVDPLFHNYRLTIENAKVVEHVPRPNLSPDISDLCVRHGEKPRLIKAASFDAQLDRIIEIIRNRSLTNVGILMRYNTTYNAGKHSGNEKRSVQYVKEYFEGKGITVEYKYNINQDTDMDLDFHSSNPKILTWWCAKGLQFKDVFIIDCNTDYVCGVDEKENRRYASAWYVALSRTSERLYISYTGNLSKRFPATSSNLYANPDIVNNFDDDLPF